MTSPTAPRPPRRGFDALKGLLLATAFGLAPSVLAQQPYAEGPLLDIVTGMREGSWAQVSKNRYEEVWAPPELRPLYNKSNHPPSKIIGAWSSYAWDSNRGCVIIYGGGHANYPGNDVYRWCAGTLRWERASLPSEIKDLGSNVFTAIDGVDNAPTSAHTYDNAVFLPLIDRYMNFGGALFNTGGPYMRPSESDPTVFRRTGPYLFDPARADPFKVGGTTGSHVKREGPHTEVLGGAMWQNRDIYAYWPLESLPLKHVAGCTAYSYEADEHDVIYVGARGGGTALHLYRYQVTDPVRPWLDRMEMVGQHWTGSSAQTTCAHDPVTDIVLRTGINSSPFHFWDLATAGPKNRNQEVEVTGSVATFVQELDAMGFLIRDCGMDYDPLRSQFVLWCGAGPVWTIKPPNPLSRSGWRVTRQPTPVGTVPPAFIKNGILGKWKYIPGLDVFIGLEGLREGNIWVYKPVNWTPDGSGGTDPSPTPTNQPPVVSLTSPTDGTTTTPGSVLQVAASASDPDGSISKLTLRVNGEVIGVSNTSPYSVNWTAPATGNFSMAAEAVDNQGATALSSTATVTVAEGGGDGSLTVLRRQLSSYNGAADTYLSSYYVNRNYGGSGRLEFNQTRYVPLVRFAVFASEGGPIPNTAVIQSATLRLYKSSYDETIALHAMLRPWLESEATWNQPRAGASWAMPGAGGAGSDYRASADTVTAAPFAPGWVDFDVTARVRSYATGTANHGWRLVAQSTNGNRKEFHSSEYSTADLYPRLEVRWQPAN